MIVVIIDLMTFDTIRITLAGSDVYRGFNRICLFWTCAGVTVRPAVMQCGAAPPLCRRRPYLTDPRRSPGALPAALVATIFSVPNEHRCAALR